MKFLYDPRNLYIINEKYIEIIFNNFYFYEDSNSINHLYQYYTNFITFNDEFNINNINFNKYNKIYCFNPSIILLNLIDKVHKNIYICFIFEDVSI